MVSGWQSSARWSTVPLPLVQLVHACQCAKTAAERFFYVRQLWETCIKFLGSVCLASWLQRQAEPGAAQATFPSLWRLDPEDPASAASQTSLSQWWRWVRLLLPGLCNAHESFALRLRDWLHRDYPSQEHEWVSQVRQIFGLSSSSAWPRTPAAWFEHYVLSASTLAALEPAACEIQPGDTKTHALLQALSELLTPGNFFEQVRCVFLARVEQEAEEVYRLERFDLTGKASRRLPPLRVAIPATTAPPIPGRVYLELAPNLAEINRSVQPTSARRIHLAPWTALPLHPLLLHLLDTEETVFLQAFPSEREAVFVSPTTGRVYQEPSASASARQLAEQLLKHPVTSDLGQKWLACLTNGQAEASAGNRLATHQATGFELLSELPCGQDAVQYRAWQLSLRRPVRLQCQLLHQDGQAFPEEELAGLYTLLRLNNPHLIKVYEHGVSEGVAYVATELVPGVSLASVMEQLHLEQRQSLPDLNEWYQAIRLASQEEHRKERPLCDLHTYERRLARYLLAPRWPEAAGGDASPTDPHGYVRTILECMGQLAESVHCFHENGLAHGSIVPGRILLSYEDGRPILLEPSHRRDVAGAGGLTQSLRYLSPERRSGVARLTPQADVYSLAAITLELLALPSETALGHDAASLARHGTQLGLPAELVAFLCRCVSKKPEERPESALVLAQRLRDFAQAIAPAKHCTSTASSTPPAKATGENDQTSQTTVPPHSREPARSDQPRQQPRSARRWLVPATVLLLCLALAPATFYALAWWMGVKPVELLRLLAHRTVGRWHGFRDNASVPAPSTNALRQAVPPSDTGPASAPAGPNLDDLQKTIHLLQQQLAAERQRAQEIHLQYQQQEQLLAKQRAHVASLEKLLAASNQEALVKRLRQELAQTQADNATLQQRYQSAQEELAKLAKQLQTSQLAEKQLREELAGLTLKMESLAAEVQSLRHTPPGLELSPEFVLHWLHLNESPTFRHTLAQQARRPYVAACRDALASRLQKLESQQIPPVHLAAVFAMLGLWEHDLGSQEAAQNAYKQAWNILNRVPGEARQQAEYLTLLYCVPCASARLYQELKKFSEAEAAWLQALAAVEKLCQANQEARWTAEQARCQAHLATLYRQARQLDKAEAAWRNALRVWEKLAGQRAEEPAYALGLARCYQDLAHLAELRDQVELADQNYQQAISILENTLERYQQHPEIIRSLARVLAERAALYRDSGQARESLTEFQRALQLLRPLATGDSASLETILTLRDIYAGRAHAHLALRQYAEALRDWDEAISCDCERSPTLRAYRAICLARLGSTEQAVAHADRLLQDYPRTGSLLYNLACVHAVVAEVLGQENKQPSPEQSRQSEAHATRALELLSQAADQGYFRSPHRLEYLQRDPDLEAIRQRADFKRFLEKLQASPQPSIP
ncbi:hypothetical protein HRbin36_00820 [bacterium HR36]|nr:hypothetical protein HRbin36_00820 [bacterium HR36]